MRQVRQIVFIGAMVATLSILPTLSPPSGASPAPGIIQGMINHCPATSAYQGRVTVTVHYATGALAMSTSTLPKTRLTHFSFYTPPGNYFVIVHANVSLRWPYHVRFFHVSSGKNVQLPKFESVCAPTN